MAFVIKKLVAGMAIACFAIGASQTVLAKTARKAPVTAVSGTKAKVAKKVAARKGAKAAKADQPRAVKGRAKARGARVAAAAAGPVKASLIRPAVEEKREAGVQIPEDQFVAQQLRQQTTGNLVLNSACACMFNQDNGRVLFEKNADSRLPVASLTKLMSALVIMRSDLPMNEEVTVEREDYNLPSSSFSRLRVGMTLSRSDLLHVALTGSDNRAIHALA